VEPTDGKRQTYLDGAAELQERSACGPLYRRCLDVQGNTPPGHANAPPAPEGNQASGAAVVDHAHSSVSKTEPTTRFPTFNLTMLTPSSCQRPFFDPSTDAPHVERRSTSGGHDSTFCNSPKRRRGESVTADLIFQPHCLVADRQQHSTCTSPWKGLGGDFQVRIHNGPTNPFALGFAISAERAAPLGLVWIEPARGR
jgi:hypothetical protein